jgi:hypothetical protein
LDSGKSKWLWLLVIAAVFALALGVSFFLCADVAKSCLWAVIISVIGGGCGLAPVIYAALVKKAPSVASVLAVTVIRLLITVGGAAIIITSVRVQVLWFAAWLGLFYLVILAAEVCFIITVLKDKKFESA